MKIIRKAKERGSFDHGWLQTSHSFSFADYYDPAWMGFSALRVINEDVIAPGEGFGLHPHRDMEIVTYILSGTLTHEDSMGHRTPLGPGEVQYMSAGKGVLHSEFNHSSIEPVHLLQIWILPNVKGVAPRYSQSVFSDNAKRTGWLPIVTPDGHEGSHEIRQDASLFATILKQDESRSYTIPPGRSLWIQVARGAVGIAGERLEAGDGFAAEELESITCTGNIGGAELLLFDLPSR